MQVEANFSQDKFLALPKGNWRISASNPVGPVTATGIHLIDLSTAILGPCDEVLASLRTLAQDWENGDNAGHDAELPQWRHGPALRHPHHALRRAHRRLWLQGLGGSARRAHPENSEGWTATYVIRDQPREDLSYAPAPAVRLNLEAFAQAATAVRRTPWNRRR